MELTLRRAARLRGSLTLPGDKSISHRYAILASLAEGRTTIANFATGADCHSTLGALRGLGVSVAVEGSTVTIDGTGLHGWRAPEGNLDAGNSGSAMRMLCGPLAAQSFHSRIVGDESLSRRPMKRILVPLREMGARISARDEQFPPLDVEGRGLTAIDYTLPVASAQVKSCVLLAGIFCEGTTVVREPVRTRDHTEIALREFGAEIEVRSRAITLVGRPALQALQLTVPSDLSSAAFFLVAALSVPGSELTLRGVGLNPTRSVLLDVLLGMGASIRVLDVSHAHGETVGDLLVSYAPVRGGTIEGATTAALIDELPALAILGAVSENGLIVRDAAELRVKETDRIAAVVENLRRMGVEAEERPDGFAIAGRQRFRSARINSFGDHRIAMAFAIAALLAEGETTIADAEAASVSFPEFYELLAAVTEAS